MRKENYGAVRAVKKICKNCKYFSQDYEADETGLNKNLVKHGWGECHNKLFQKGHIYNPPKASCLMFIYDYFENEDYYTTKVVCMANFMVHENFGCIGWEKNE